MRSRTFRMIILIMCMCGTSITTAQSFYNGGFEELADCPPEFGSDLSIQQTMEAWYSVQGTPDGFHVTCPAIHPMNTPGVPMVAEGDGYGALWGPNEVFGQQLTAPLFHGQTYCIQFIGKATAFGGSGIGDGEPCARVCAYGSMEMPPPAPQFPIPISSMPGVFLLGCSAPLVTAEWIQNEIFFLADQAYPHLLFTSAQAPECPAVSPYLALDQLSIVECISTDITAIVTDAVQIHWDRASGRLRISTTEAGMWLMIYDASGRSIHQEQLAAADGWYAPTDLKSGVYIATMVNAQGNMMAHERILVL